MDGSDRQSLTKERDERPFRDTKFVNHRDLKEFLLSNWG